MLKSKQKEQEVDCCYFGMSSLPELDVTLGKLKFLYLSWYIKNQFADRSSVLYLHVKKQKGATKYNMGGDGECLIHKKTITNDKFYRSNLLREFTLFSTPKALKKSSIYVSI